MTTTRTRPIGLSHGAPAFVAAWLGAGAIARLTGTPVVLAMMAALLVAVAVEMLAGWSTVRRFRVRSIAGPPVTTAGSATVLRLGVDGPAIRHDGRLRLSTGPRPGAEIVAIELPATTTDGADSFAATGVFATPGVVSEIHASIEFAGPLGLFWWRRTGTVVVESIHVAPVAAGDLLDIARSSSVHDGPASGAGRNHRGDVDGVRPWRDGDAVGAIHWPSALRAGELIVHDRAAATDEHWVVNLDEVLVEVSAASVASQLRHTLDEGLQRGHDVAVDLGGERSTVRTDDDAARWAAVVAERIALSGDTTSSPPWWQRQIALTRRDVEPSSTVRGPARWGAAAAALASLTMLGGALDPSAALFATIAAGVVFGVVVSLWVARHAGRRPAALQIAIALALVAALAVIADNARGVDGFVAALRGPLPHLLMLLVVLHGFEVVDRRTMRVHQAITFVVAAYAAGLRLDDALGWWIAVWGTALFASMLLTTRSTPTRPSAIPTPGSSLRSIAWVGAAAVGTLAVLSVVPVPDGPARLGLPAQSARSPEVSTPGGLASPDGSPAPSGGTDRSAIGDATGYPGFTERLDTSLRGDLGEDVVMRVRAPEPAFWRGQTFSEFDGRSWSVSPDLGARQDGPIIDVPPSLGDVSGRSVPTEELIQTYYVEAGLPNVVFAAARPTQVIFDGSLWIRPDGAMRSDVTLAPDSIYTVISERVAVTADMLRAQGDLGTFFSGFHTTASGWQIDPFLALPDSTTQRTIDLAASLRAPGESTYDTILRYEQWLSANTEYDLDAPVPADGADAVDDFLFRSRRGFCEQIASSLAIMLRSQGVPTRLVTGFIPGERDRVSGVWKVRERDAHAWVEVWFPKTGWQAFDPTAAVPLAGDVDAGTVGGDLVGAAASSIASHRVELGLLALAATIAWLGVRALASLHRRRDRGRWGLLQDRFAALGRPVLAGSITNDAAMVMTNPRRAGLIDGPEDDLAASVAATLDRAAFDPAWVDDDELYELTRQAVAMLERDARA